MYQRFLELMEYYNRPIVPYKYSIALQLDTYTYTNCLKEKSDQIVKIIAYCLMPDHYHLLVKIKNDTCFSQFISNIENSFSRYFNLLSKRKGPLWQSRFKDKRIRTNEQLLHVSRYIHLNPVTNYLIDNPIHWVYSSYRDYILSKTTLSETMTEISIKDPMTYKRFVEDQIDYQRALKSIKRLLLE